MIRLINSAQFLGPGMHMHKTLVRYRHIEAMITMGRHLPQTRADHQQQIRSFMRLTSAGLAPIPICPA
ncbi:hypothetical protein JCM17845_24380 [Iodidimonas gelatinilytica]|uniref:Uncharacterized protein n=1 Tax=Iodidimonas gelatinilytica TaxID=1236966 RepID=A0A5A7N2A8_9PROT|nr:hypothetical protein JCM17845_24380 [Iodidimonas gelatinilytica]